MGYVVTVTTGIVLLLLYHYYAGKTAAAQPAAPVPSADEPPSGGGGDTPVEPPVAPPAPPTITTTWEPIPEGAQLTPGADYRASAPPQGMLVMAMIPGHLDSAGFTNVVIHKPGDVFPDDWPDTGEKLRIEATLPEGAQPQAFNLDGVSVWRKTVTSTPAQVAGTVLRHVAQGVYEAAQQVRTAPRWPSQIPIPASNGVYAGLVRPPQSW